MWMMDKVLQRIRQIDDYYLSANQTNHDGACTELKMLLIDPATGLAKIVKLHEMAIIMFNS